jgi:predicted adenine nucleotide alpha hydrolase (AANH) superfamily ATPase
MKILFHICCSNCALYPFKLLRDEGHDLTGFWYNPNIQPYDEYQSRLDSLRKLSDDWHIDIFYDKEYRPDEFLNRFKFDDAAGLNDSDHIPPAPERCKICYTLRLEKAAAKARDEGFEAFSTTLLMSPYQDFEHIDAIGRELSGKYNLYFYLRDFRPYFRNAMSLARELGLYRQKYCGCLFSKQERENAITAEQLSKARNREQ